MAFDDALGMKIALEEARKGFEEGGIPIGACLLTEEGEIVGRGHNMRVQNSSATLHGETSCLENAGRLSANVYKKCTLYSTLSPCSMCTGAALLFKIPRIVIGENDTFVGAEEWIQHEGVEFLNLHNAECKYLMQKFIENKPEVWNEDIGV